jgi:hypothetical protein
MQQEGKREERLVDIFQSSSRRDVKAGAVGHVEHDHHDVPRWGVAGYQTKSEEL